MKAVSATTALAKRGIPLLRAKRAVEEMIANGRAVVMLPTVEDRVVLKSELAEYGVSASTVAGREVDVRKLRERLGLTQEQFSLRYGIDIDTLQNWERRRRIPDQAAQSYLRVIERLPVEASEAQEEHGIASALST